MSDVTQMLIRAVPSGKPHAQLASVDVFDSEVQCSVLQCAAVCCSVLQCVAVASVDVFDCEVQCSVLQCVAVCCSVLQLPL